MSQSFALSAFHTPVPVSNARRNLLLRPPQDRCRPNKPTGHQQPVHITHAASRLSLPANSQRHHDAFAKTEAPSTTAVSTNQSRQTHPVIHVASSRAVTPMRRPREDAASHFTEEQQLPSQRRSDMMAPKTTGFWAIIPYMAASAVLLGMGWIAKKRFIARQQRLVEEFGQVIVFYGNSPDAKREIASEYKGKLGPGILRGALFASYMNVLVTEKPITPSTIQDVSIVKRLLKLSDDRVVTTLNTLGESLQDAPSLLGKVLFLAERIVAPEKVAGFSLIPLFPYSPPTVADLQRNMLERCFKEFVNDEIENNNIEEPPATAAAALRIDPTDAQTLFDAVVLNRIRKKEALEAELAAAEAEEASKPNAPELDYPARSGEPAKAAVHAFQCGDCGYTLFPAAGREFKFYGDDFVCPTCGAPKDKFIDVNSD